jgi:hypothetical protein
MEHRAPADGVYPLTRTLVRHHNVHTPSHSIIHRQENKERTACIYRTPRPKLFVPGRHSESSDSRRQEAASIFVLRAMARYRKLGRVYREGLEWKKLIRPRGAGAQRAADEHGVGTAMGICSMTGPPA